MTLDEKNKIYQLKKEGYGYKKIANELGISVSSVQSFLFISLITKHYKKPNKKGSFRSLF
mgnify:CR=1 FL=1